MKFSEALAALRQKSKKRNFDQTLDLIINLKDLDLKRSPLSIVVGLPFPHKKKKIAAILESNPTEGIVDYVITKDELDKISEEEMKKLARNYDFFIASAKLMPLIAKRFGRVLSAAGKIPDPALGAVLAQESRETITATVAKLSTITKIKLKEASLKIAIGKESMSDQQLEQNALAALAAIVAVLPKGERNIKNVLLKFTMSPTVKVRK